MISSRIGPSRPISSSCSAAGTSTSSSVATRSSTSAVELAPSDLHSVVCLPHAATGVGAGTACRLAHLVDEHLQPRHIGPCELLVDPVIACTALNEGIHDRLDRVRAADTPIQRRHRYLPTLLAGGFDATTPADTEQGRICSGALFVPVPAVVEGPSDKAVFDTFCESLSAEGVVRPATQFGLDLVAADGAPMMPT
jgi:hypothetical protein